MKIETFSAEETYKIGEQNVEKVADIIEIIE